MPETQDDTRPVRKITSRSLLVIGDEEILFDPDKLLLSEVIAVETQAGLIWPQVTAGLAVGTASALRAAVWIMRKRHNPKLKLSEVEFNWGDVAQQDPDYRPEYGGLAPGEAFGDEETPADADGNDTADDTNDENDGPKDSESATFSLPLAPQEVGPTYTGDGGPS